MKSPKDSRFTLVVLTITIASGFSLPDPCPDHFHNSTIVDMCRESSARELADTGNYLMDSVLIRSSIQDNCSCFINIGNAASGVSLYVSQIEASDSMSSIEFECGLNIYITRMDKTTNELESMKTLSCTTRFSASSIGIQPNQILQFKTKVINGSFTRGYCIKIERADKHSADGTLQIYCNGLFSNEKNTDEVTESKNNDNIGNTVITVVAAIVWVTAAVLVIYIIWDKVRKMVDTRKSNHENPPTNYEIPRYQPSNYHNITKTSPEHQYETISSNNR